MSEELENNPNCIVKAFEDHPIFIFSEHKENKKEYYFKALDIGKVLDIVNIRTSIQNFDNDEVVVRPTYDTLKRKQDTIFLTSHGVYRLLYSSKKPLAKKFRKWAGDILDDIIFNESQELKKKIEANEQKIKKIEELHKEEIKKVEGEKNWLNKISKNKVTFKKYELKTDGIYIGSDTFNHQNFIEKIGKSIKNRGRERDLASSSAPDAAYKMFKKYDVFKGLELDTEKYIHAILDPLHVNSDNSSTEHYMIHQSIAAKIIDKIINDQNTTIEIVNNYLDLLEEHKYDFDLVEKILNDLDKSDEVVNDTEVMHKTCNECNQYLIIYKFVFDEEDNSHSDTCEICIENYSNKLINDIVTSTLNGKKKCNGCKTIYNNDMFYKDKDDIRKLTDMCKQCYNNKEETNCKQCIECYEILQYHNFAKHGTLKDGHSTKCRSCVSKNKISVICEYCQIQVLECNLKNHQKTVSCKASREDSQELNSLSQQVLDSIPEQCSSSEMTNKLELAKQIELSENSEENNSLETNDEDDTYDDEDAVRKQCTECEKILLIKNFYIADPIKQTYRSKCISCYGKQSRELKRKINEDPMILKKKCDKCHEILDKTMFFKDSTNGDDHFINTCIACYNGNIGKIHKHCNQCNKIKSVDNFANDKTHSDKKSTLCKACKAINEKARRDAMPKAVCDICNKEVTHSNLPAHKRTKTCLAIAEKNKSK